MVDTVIFLTSGTSWAVPGDFNASANTVEAIGAGGDGVGTTAFAGGGGAYAKVTNFSPGGGTVSFQIGVHGGTTGSGTGPTSNTWFDSGATLVAAGGVSGAANAAGGSTANSVGSTKFAGGNAGATVGGGGAAGPDGAGLNGNGVSGAGGAGDNGNANGGVGGTVGAGRNGGNGTSWTSNPGGATAGAGGGGSVDAGVANGGTGGLYGAGGGAGVTTGGAGANGIIVITYTPAGGAATPGPLATADGDRQLPRALFVPIPFRTEYTRSFFFPPIALTPATDFFAGGDPLPRAAFNPVPFRTEYTREPFAFPGVVPLVPTGFLSHGDDPLPRARFVPVLFRTGYARPAFFIPPALTPTQFGWHMSSHAQEATRVPALRAGTMLRSVSFGAYTIAPPTPTRVFIRRFTSVSPPEIVSTINTLINEMNLNFANFSVAFVMTVPLMQLIVSVDQVRIVDGVNAFIEQVNIRLLKMGLGRQDLVQLFVIIPPEELSLAFDELVQDLNIALARAFGS